MMITINQLNQLGFEDVSSDKNGNAYRKQLPGGLLEICYFSQFPERERLRLQSTRSGFTHQLVAVETVDDLIALWYMLTGEVLSVLPLDLNPQELSKAMDGIFKIIGLFKEKNYTEDDYVELAQPGMRVSLERINGEWSLVHSQIGTEDGETLAFSTSDPKLLKRFFLKCAELLMDNE